MAEERDLDVELAALERQLSEIQEAIAVLKRAKEIIRRRREQQHSADRAREDSRQLTFEGSQSEEAKVDSSGLLRMGGRPPRKRPPRKGSIAALGVEILTELGHPTFSGNVVDRIVERNPSVNRASAERILRREARDEKVIKYWPEGAIGLAEWPDSVEYEGRPRTP